MGRNIYVVMKDGEVTCYSNLTKVIHNTPSITYFPIYSALKSANSVTRNGVTIIKTQLK